MNRILLVGTYRVRLSRGRVRLPARWREAFGAGEAVLVSRAREHVTLVLAASLRQRGLLPDGSRRELVAWLESLCARMEQAAVSSRAASHPLEQELAALRRTDTGWQVGLAWTDRYHRLTLPVWARELLEREPFVHCIGVLESAELWPPSKVPPMSLAEVRTALKQLGI